MGRCRKVIELRTTGRWLVVGLSVKERWGLFVGKLAFQFQLNCLHLISSILVLVLVLIFPIYPLAVDLSTNEVFVV